MLANEGGRLEPSLTTKKPVLLYCSKYSCSTLKLHPRLLMSFNFKIKDLELITRRKAIKFTAISGVFLASVAGVTESFNFPF